MSLAAAHAGNGTADIVSVLLSYWWLALLFGGAVLEFIGEVFDIGVSGLKRRAKVRHKRRMELRKLDLQILQAKAGVIAAPGAAAKPGPCVHRHVSPVIAADESVAAWLCRSCDTQLPADWAVRQEDL